MKSPISCLVIEVKKSLLVQIVQLLWHGHLEPLPELQRKAFRPEKIEILVGGQPLAGRPVGGLLAAVGRSPEPEETDGQGAHVEGMPAEVQNSVVSRLNEKFTRKSGGLIGP